MEVRSKQNDVHIAPRKVRLVVDVVRGKPVREALSMLRFMPQSAAVSIGKAIKSALANAENNFALDAEDLIIKAIAADDGATQKRFRPRAHGRVSPLLKRTTNISVVLAERETTNRA